MAIIRVEKRSNFTVLDNTAIRDKDLSLKALGLYVKMMSLPPEWNYSVAGLAAICKEGMSSIRSALKELEQAGYLTRDRKNNEKGYFVYEYTLRELPQTPCKEKQHTVESHTVESYAEESQTEKHTQLNKESLSTKELNIKELNKEKENKNKGLSVSEADAVLSELIEDEELIDLYKDYISMREEIDAPLTARSLKLLIARCERLSEFDTNVQKTMLENALIQQWKSVYPIADSEKRGRNAMLEDFGRVLFGGGGDS